MGFARQMRNGDAPFGRGKAGNSIWDLPRPRLYLLRSVGSRWPFEPQPLMGR